MNLKSFTVIFLSLFTSLIINAQQDYFQGYTESLSGTNFTYHSPIPEVEQCLLARANKNFPALKWKTEVIPANYNKSYVEFIWVYGMDVMEDGKYFNLSVNDKQWFRFGNPLSNEKEKTIYYSEENASLTFRRTLIDKHNDQMGFVILKIPASAIIPGEKAIISVEGEHQGSAAWYMTFKTQVKERLIIKQSQVIVKENEKQYHIARFYFTHIGKEEEVKVRINKLEENVLLKPGQVVFDFKLEVVDQPTKFIAQIQNKNKPIQEIEFTLKPLKDWTIYLVQHTHTDIGYTRSQTEILSEHLRYIDYALDYCDQTDNYPDNAKFRWTCEASWAVREYFNSRPEAQINRLIKRVNEGRIEVTGMFFNFSEIVDETAVRLKTFFCNYCVSNICCFLKIK
ncbi:MAG: hypothetical protein Q7J34_04285 [Bacteroidales bacterium]|nr:hypothetical protein [Bacteroidales bacterium]